LKTDAETAIKYILGREDLRNSPILLYGQSLGGAVAIYLADKHQDEVIPQHMHTLIRRIADDNQVDALIIENTFTDMPTVARKSVSSPLSSISYVVGVLTHVFVAWEYQDYITLPRSFAAKNGDP